MERLLGFEDEATDGVDSESAASSSCSYKLVPWLSWDEWDAVRVSLFSSSPDSVASALRRISAWKSRGCLPVAIDVTASFIEIQQKDPFFSKNLASDASSNLDEILAMLYCMSIMRLVNGVIEKTRKKTGLSIADAAGAIGIPRMLIDIRHECSHRELPALPLVRDASIEALGWLKSYYWEPQKKAMPCKSDESLCAKKQVKSKLRELASILRNKHSLRMSSSAVGEQRISLYGQSKVLLLMAGRRHTYAGSKKQISKILKILLLLYSSFSTEVVSVFVDFLMKVVKSFDTLDISQEIQSQNGTLTSLDDWKLLMSKLSNKEPTLLLSVLDAVLDMIETEEANDNEAGIYHMASSECRAKTHQIADLSTLFAWLVEIMMGLKSFRCKHSSSETEVPTATKGTLRKMLIELLRKCLRVAAHGNKQLMDTAIQISQATEDKFLVNKLDKLRSLACTSSDFMNGSPEMSSETSAEREEDIQLAAQKLESVRLRQTKSEVLNTRSSEPDNLNRWVVAKSWKPCPVGMLPQDFGFSGRLPFLDCKTSEVPEVLERNPRWQLNRCTGKREARHDTDLPCDSSNKKMKETVTGCDTGDADVAKGIGGCLMMGGIWKTVGPEDLEAIKSAIRIFA